MKKKNTIVKVRLLPNGKAVRIMPDGSLKPLGKGKTDWERVRNMTEKEITAAALSDPDNPPMSKQELKRFRPAFPNVRRIREKLNMTQKEFASHFLLSLPAIRDWEQGRSNPDHAARALLLIVDHLPKQAMKALGTDSTADTAKHKKITHRPEHHPSL